MESKRTSPLGPTLVFAVAIAVLFVGLGTARLWDRDEPRNAQCAAEMFASGELIVPTFAGELRTHKPVLLYWCQMTAYSLVGVNAWGARLPSALGGLLSVIFCYLTASRLMGRSAAVWSSLVLVTSTMFVVASRAATPDSLLIACSSCSIYCFLRAAFSPFSEAAEVTFRWPTFRQWCSVYAVCSFAVLAKGPIGFVLPASVIGCVLLWNTWREPSLDNKTDKAYSSRVLTWLVQRVRQGFTVVWSMRPFTAIAIISCIAGPWYLAVGLQTDGVWLREFFWTHNIGRATSAMEGHSGPPILYYLGALVVGTFPWSIWLFTSWLYAWHVWREQPKYRPAIILAIVWMVVYIGCFSMAATKLPSYITPCFPGAALLYGLLLSHWAEQRTSLLRWGRVGLAIGVLVGVAMVFAAGTVRVGESSLVVLAPAAVLFVVCAVFAASCLARGTPSVGVRMYAVGAVGLILNLAILGPAMVDRSRGDLNYLTGLKPTDTPLVAYVGEVEPSWVFYGSPVTQQLATSDWQNEALRFLSTTPHRKILLDSRQFQALELVVAEIASESKLSVVTTLRSGIHDRVVHVVELQDRSGALVAKFAAPLRR